MKLLGLVKIRLKETYSRVQVDKNLSDIIPIRNCLKKGDALKLLLLKFALDYAILKAPSITRWLENKWYTSAFGLRL
jgi:hypothetical protein